MYLGKILLKIETKKKGFYKCKGCEDNFISKQGVACTTLDVRN